MYIIYIYNKHWRCYLEDTFELWRFSLASRSYVPPSLMWLNTSSSKALKSLSDEIVSTTGLPKGNAFSIGGMGWLLYREDSFHSRCHRELYRETLSTRTDLGCHREETNGPLLGSGAYGCKDCSRLVCKPTSKPHWKLTRNLKTTGHWFVEENGLSGCHSQGPC